MERSAECARAKNLDAVAFADADGAEPGRELGLEIEREDRPRKADARVVERDRAVIWLIFSQIDDFSERY